MKVVAANRRARFDFEILDTFEAGLKLTGPEVKSIREGQADLRGSYVLFQKGIPVIKGMKIAKYKYAASITEYDPERERALLLKKSEMEKLESSGAEKGMTIIPLELRVGKFVKVLIGIARGRKTVDKRQRIKERDVEKRLRKGDQ